jgi:hypothetical protein
MSAESAAPKVDNLLPVLVDADGGADFSAVAEKSLEGCVRVGKEKARIEGRGKPCLHHSSQPTLTCGTDHSATGVG